MADFVGSTVAAAAFSYLSDKEDTAITDFFFGFVGFCILLFKC